MCFRFLGKKPCRYPPKNDHISHGKGNSSSKIAFGWDMLVPRGVHLCYIDFGFAKLQLYDFFYQKISREFTKLCVFSALWDTRFPDQTTMETCHWRPDFQCKIAIVQMGSDTRIYDVYLYIYIWCIYIWCIIYIIYMIYIYMYDDVYIWCIFIRYIAQEHN